MDGERLSRASGRAGLPDLDTLLEAEADYYRLGVLETFERDGALFVRDARVPRIYDANHVRLVRSDDAGATRLWDALHAEYAVRGHRPCLVVDPLTTPPSLEARCAHAGWERDDALLMALPQERDVPGRGAADLRIAPLEGVDAWDAFWALKQLDEGSRGWLPSIGLAWRDYVRRKTPALRYWMAWRGETAVGWFSELVVRGLGLLEDLWVTPHLRGRGVATALVAHCARAARGRGAGACFLSAKVDDTPKWMYEKLGFVPMGVVRTWRGPA